MNRRIARMGFLAGLISMVIMVVLAKWGYVKPAPTVANVYGANAFWNFTFLEMFGGTFMIWFIVWGIIYKVVGKLKAPHNSQGNFEMSEKQLEQTESNTVVDHDGKFNTSVRFGTFAYDGKDNIVGINGRTLKVVDLSENNEPYFQAWVDGYQNDGNTHNEAVKNALNFAAHDIRSNQVNP